MQNVDRELLLSSGDEPNAIEYEQRDISRPDDLTGGRMNANVDVVILAWNDGEVLSDAIDSALESIGVDVTVTVVDNGSNTPVSPPPDPRVTVVINSTNRGVAPGRAQGIDTGHAPFVCLLDSDARLQPNTLEALVQPMLIHQEIGLTAPVFTDQLPSDSAGPAPTFTRKLQRAGGFSKTYATGNPFAESGLRDVDFAIGACQLIRRSAYEQVGGLDTSIFYGPEDVDFGLRLRDGGWRVVQVKDAACHHPPRRRNRKPFSKAGIRHAGAIAKHLWTHRNDSLRAAGERVTYDVNGICTVSVESTVPNAQAIGELLDSFQLPTASKGKVDIEILASVRRAAARADARLTRGRRGPGFTYGDSWFLTQDDKVLIAETDGQFIVGAERTMDRSLLTLVDWIIARREHALIHSAAVAINGRAALISGWGGVGKTATITNLCRNAGASFLFDDMGIVAADGSVLPLPKPMIIYPYHAPLFPELFARDHKALVPISLTPLAERARNLVRPFFESSPTLEAWARRVNPQHMKTLPGNAIPGLQIPDRAKCDLVVRLERSAGEHAEVTRTEMSEVVDGLVYEFFGEQTAGTGLSLPLAASSSGVYPLQSWLDDRRSALRSFVGGRDLVRVQVPQSASAEETSAFLGGLITDALQ